MKSIIIFILALISLNCYSNEVENGKIEIGAIYSQGYNVDDKQSFDLII